MPLIMDDAIDMDDLFGDEPVMALTQPTSAKGLVERVEEMRLGGGCTRLAWSKLGYIAYITPDRSGVILRNQICNPEDGKWMLSKEYSIQEAQSLHEGSQLDHLSWNHAGSDLAIVDAMGRISIFNVIVVSNQMSPSRSCLADQDDDLNAVAGLSWLNPERQFPLYRPATQVDGQFQYIGPSTRALGPFHPQNKSALISVTRGASIRLLYQQLDNKWLETITELETLAASDEMISHASFCADKDNTLLLAVRTLTSSCRLYRISINWNLPASQKDKIAQMMVLPHPTLTVRPLKVDGLALEDTAIQTPNSHDPPRPVPQLSYLEMISPAPHAKGVEPTTATLLAIFTHVPLNPQDDLQTFSSVARWDLQVVPMKLHGSFDLLASKKIAAGSANVPSLDFNRLDVEIVNKIVLGVQQLSSHNAVSLAYSDGSIEFRDRNSWSVLKQDDDVEKVSSMTQVGFAFTKTEPCLHTILSPNSCLAIQLDADGSAHLRAMEYTRGPLELSSDDGRARAVIAALTMSFVYYCTHHNNIDDILMVIKSLSSPALELAFLSENYLALSLNVDHSIEPNPQKLFRNIVLQRCLSMQNSLGYHGESSTRNLSAKLAWVALHLRCISLLFAVTFNSGPKAGGQTGVENDFTRPEVLQSLTGVIRYSIDLIAFLTDALFTLSKHLNVSDNTPLTLANLQTALHNLSSPALPLLLASTPRTFLRYNCRALRGLLTASTKSLPATTSILRRQAFTTVISLIEGSAAVKVAAFERVLADVDASVKAGYGDMAEAERGVKEKELLIRAEVPHCMLKAVEKLLGPTLTGLREEIDPSALYFKDLAWLGLNDDKSAKRWWQKHRVDGIRKLVVPAGAVGSKGWRRCTRCCAWMEELGEGKGTGLEKMCFCGSLWMAV